MKHRAIGRWLSRFFLVIALAGCSFAFAQAEPSLNQIYSSAQAGKLDEAQVMIQQVLVAHPKSAKAHYVRAELFARQGKLALAKESLATAEKLSPGLPFAKPEAVQALRAQISNTPPSRAANAPAVNNAAAAPQSSSSSSMSWGLPLLILAGVIAVGYFVFRRKPPMAQPPVYPGQSGLSGPQSFGAGPQPGYPPAYPPQGYPQGYPQQPGLGGRIMGGVATGLAVGAGLAAAEAIGRNLTGDHNSNSSAAHSDTHSGASGASGNDWQPISNQDMGGEDFGVNDGGSWDDAGSDAGGGDWDT